MIEKYGLFDSLEGDEREYAEADFARLCRAMTGNGVRGGADALPRWRSSWASIPA